ncbi:glycosyltransferase family 64 protein [Dactylonectria estremocensis]|uniref:Glycosyltransferase family 64 protein n=1 Tax=Dactylonectria estremocensis TaxID=1079267 RepID=A0A9P9E486_9HYPO|nr:glycosyltransferase family 64 protein [Dactylonectria estremocensis]
MNSNAKATPTIPDWFASLPQWLSRKGATILAAVSLSLLSLFFLTTLGSDLPVPAVAPQVAPPNGPSLAGLPECPQRQKASPDIWNAAEAKYRDLMDDKFTITILTYQRLELLTDTLKFLTSEKSPSLYEILVVWNDQGKVPPNDYVASHNVSVRFIRTPRNSMNMKFIPYAEYRTKAVLLHDDDVHYEHLDMELAFQTWRQRGQYQIVGAFGRCVIMGPDGQWRTNNCSDREYYNLVLTGLLFTHISYLDYFSSSDPLMMKIRNYIDQVFNCDDFAFNYVAQMLSCTGPYQVTGPKIAFNAHPKIGISRTKNNIQTRWQCVRDFTEFFGYMPLKNTSEHILRGVLPW